MRVAGRVFQSWLCCLYINSQLNDLNYLRFNQKQLRADTYAVIRDQAEKDDTSLQRIGRSVTILPSSFQGSPRYVTQKTHDGLAIVRRYHRPDLFITFTCNPKWPEIQKYIPKGCSSGDFHDIVCRVFHLKLKELMKDLTKRHIFGRAIAWCYSIEFQKRGLPHAHILLIIDRADGVANPSDVDQMVSAEIPDPTTYPELHKKVMDYMIHRKCANRPRAPCKDKDGNCSKKFPKPFREETIFQPEGGYPEYRRREVNPPRDDGITNEDVVAYCAYLLMKYDAHINVEVCSSVKAIQYIYKYIYKGSAQADMRVGILDEHAPLDEGVPPDVDEIGEFQTGRWVGSSEGAWRILGFSMGEMYPPIQRLSLELPNQQDIHFNPNAVNAAELMDKEKARRTTLTAFFELNKQYKEAIDNGQPAPFQLLSGKNPLDILYADVPEYYVWERRKKSGDTSQGYQWKPRQKGFSIGRMHFVGPKAGDRFWLRQLLLQLPAPTGFDDICTLNGLKYTRADGSLDFRAACFARGFCDDDVEWHDALNEGDSYSSPPQLRHLFTTILTECHPIDPRGLWEAHKDR